MGLNLESFGSVIATARKEKGLSQKELAAKILKEDGLPITPQYLNDIEHDRRSPSSDHLVRQFAKVLGIEPNALYGVIGLLPEHERRLVRRSTASQVEEAFVAFRKSLQN